MSRQLLENIVPGDWDSQEPGVNSGFDRTRWLQGVNDLVNRPVINRLTNSTSATAINGSGNVQSSGIGTGPQQPKRYAEFTVKARVTFNVNASTPAYVYVYRTLITPANPAIPANGAAPHAGDVIVGGDAFAGGTMTSGVNQAAAFSFLDSGLDVTKRYAYYLAIKCQAGKTLNLVNSSQLLVMERS